MIIVDTNIISALMSDSLSPNVADWIDDCDRSSLWTTAICTMEVRFGIESLHPGRRRSAMEQAFEGLLNLSFSGRVHDFDEPASQAAARLQAERKRRGIVIDVRDQMIAGIALSRGATLATRNEKHFADAGIRLVNPFGAGQKR
jgi:hypothetical protein